MSDKKKQTEWQRRFSAAFSGRKLQISKKDKQRKEVERMRAEKKRKQQEMNKRGY